MTPSERRGLGVSRIANARQIWPTQITPERLAWAGNGGCFLTQFRMIKNYQNRKSQKQFIKLLKSTDEVMVETGMRLAFSERTATATGGQRIERIQDIDTDLKCDLNPDIIYLFNATDNEP